MSTFSTTKLTGNRVLVTGTNDAGEACSTILDGSLLKYLAKEQDVLLAGDNFDRSVEDFFAPLTAAAEQLSEASAPAPMDPAFLYVIDEGREGVEEIEPHIQELDQDSAVLRMIFTKNTDRLIWIKTPQCDCIEILEYDPNHVEESTKATLEEFLSYMFGEVDDEEPTSDPGIDIQVAEDLSEDGPFEGLAEESFEPDAE